MPTPQPKAREERCAKQIAVTQMCVSAALNALLYARRDARGKELMAELETIDELLQKANELLFEYVCPF